MVRGVPHPSPEEALVAHRTARLNVFGRQLLVTRIELDRWPGAKAAEAGNRGQRRADRVADGRRPDRRVPALHPPAGCSAADGACSLRGWRWRATRPRRHHASRHGDRHVRAGAGTNVSVEIVAGPNRRREGEIARDGFAVSRAWASQARSGLYSARSRLLPANV
jgi:hypothetical protein